ncbi:hypothetical protein HD553DRAFT_327368 [Filobasidium floriforme]|uniref:uncharacterized protein n=1 Tax=Filobasidium floriforme TaxID=5210 RepID=UPI001E8ED885|nr:uncharacterized protein HD553DRAFT_327368 [Filobasidium floriforme]KAH8077236.1 hypothetical protein HD553DRAFT_327368 [Filobasidium floriforme]
MSQITSIKIDYSQDPQVSSGHSSLDRTQKGHEPGNGEAFRHSVSTAFGSRFGTDGDYGSFVIPKDAEKAELGEDELTRTFDAIIEAHPEILESNKPTSGLLQLREGFASYHSRGRVIPAVAQQHRTWKATRQNPSTEPQSRPLQMSQQFRSHEPVPEKSRSIATTGNDASRGNLESSKEAGSVLTNESVQTSAGDAVSIAKRTIPSRRELTEDEIERRACQGFAKLPKVRDTHDLWRHCSYDMEKRIRLEARQAEEVLAQAKGDSIKQDRRSVATPNKTSISMGASNSYMGTSFVPSHGVEIKREIKKEIVPRQSRRNIGSKHNATPLGLATSASSMRRLDPDQTKRDAPPRRRRINNCGKGRRKAASD